MVQLKVHGKGHGAHITCISISRSPNDSFQATIRQMEGQRYNKGKGKAM